VKVAVEPSLTDKPPADKIYVTAGLVSFISTDAEAVLTVTVSVSAPSVAWSAAIEIEIVAFPLESIFTEPLSWPPTMSPLVIPAPDNVYGTVVPVATAVVVRMKVAVEPSFAEALLAESA